MTQISAKSFERSLRGELGCAYLFHGHQSAYMDDSLAILQRHAINQGYGTFKRYYAFKGSSLDLPQVLSSLTEPSLFDDRNAILISWGDSKPAAGVLPVIVKWLDSKPSDQLLCLRCDQSLPRSDAWVKAIAQAGLVVSHGDLSEGDFLAWILRRAQSLGMSFDADSVRALAYFCNYDPKEVVQQMKWLSVLEIKGVITQAHIVQSTFAAPRSNAQKLVDCVLKGQFVEMLALVEALSNDSGAIILFLWIMRRDLMILEQIDIAGGVKGDLKELATRMRLWPARMQVLSQAHKRLQKRGISLALRKLARLEGCAKGRMRSTIPLPLLLKLYCGRISQFKG